MTKKTTQKPLKPGDSFLIVASSSPVDDEKSFLLGKEILESWGLKARFNKLINRKWRNLAGKDLVRHNELFSEENHPLIVFARGGWGSARLLEYKHKWSDGFLLGYSDPCSILLSRFASGFRGGIHGPLITSLYKEPDWSKERLKNILFGQKVPDLKGESWKGGVAKGPLIATNLTIASHLIGTSHFPNLNGCILILEDINEEPYKIDRILTQWRLAGLLNKVSGICFGNFQNPLNNKNKRENDINEILIERTKDLSIPIIGNLPFGHCIGNASIPLGNLAKMDGDKGIIRIID
tara:strand:- start:383 stop:1264 length:882 start_codon:yes stop_codon:yes gene_type:complete